MSARRLCLPVAFGLLAAGCEAADCKSLRQSVETICGAQSEALSSLTGLSGAGPEPCTDARAKLSAVVAAKADAQYHQAGKDAFCPSLAASAESLDGRIQTATYLYQDAAATAARSDLDRSIQTGDLDDAERIWQQIDALGDKSTASSAAISLGWAWLSPVVKAEQANITGATRWMSLVTSVPTEGRGCAGTSTHVVAAASDPDKAGTYFERGGAPDLLREVAYRKGDLAAFDAFEAPKAPADGAVERVNLLAALGKHDEALKEAIAAAERFTPKESRYVAYCELQLAIGRLHERAHRYVQARAAYERTNHCNASVRGRLAALKEPGIVDGEPLPRFTVTGGVRTPGVDSMRVFLTAKDPASNMSLGETVDVFANTSAHENFVRIIAVEATVENNQYQARVPAGTWTLTVVATGKSPIERGEDCWPSATVVDTDVEVPDIEVQPAALPQ